MPLNFYSRASDKNWTSSGQFYIVLKVFISVHPIIVFKLRNGLKAPTIYVSRIILTDSESCILYNVSIGVKDHPQFYK